jgi:putative zinc finger/helix-turn-helix YgiT family protein
MTQNKPTDSLHGEVCPFCSDGKLVLQQIQYSFESPDSPKVSVPGVWVDHCDVCGENIYPAATSAYIEEFLAELDDQLTPRELERIREDLGVDQGEMSEILGLGDKTYHRWEKGSQFPSRSMGYYIRILAHHPETFEWLKDRSWRKSNRISNHTANKGSSFDFGTMFPNLSDSPSSKTTTGRRWNPALGLVGVTFKL